MTCDDSGAPPACYETFRRDGVLWTTVVGALDRTFAESMIRGVAGQNPDALPYLMNFRAATAEALTSADIHALAGVLANVLSDYRGRVALLDGYRRGFESVQFFEASASFQGVAVRSFVEEARAVAWVGSGQGSRRILHSLA